MIRKSIAVLVVLSLFGFSTAYAHDSESSDEAAGAVLVAGLAFVTAAFLFSAMDRHDEYRPSPRHTPDRRHDGRGSYDYQRHDGRGDNGYGHGDYRRNDGRYQQQGPSGRTWRNWEGR